MSDVNNYQWFSHNRLEGLAKSTFGSFDKLLKEMGRTPAWYYRTRKNRAMKLRDLELICNLVKIHPADVFERDRMNLVAEDSVVYVSGISTRLSNAVAMLASSQKDFAERTGVNPAHLSYITNGNGEPGLKTLQKILAAFPQLSARWLLMGTGNMLDDTETAISLTKQLDDKQRIIDLLQDQIEHLKKG